MADFAGCLFGVQKMSLHGRSMCVVAHAATFEHGRLVSMNPDKVILCMAIETATFENKPATPI